MTDPECVGFLQWALPCLALRWTGFRKVRRQVCKRIHARIAALQLSDVRSYRVYIEGNPKEWLVLDRLCRITISRFYRDRAVFEALQQTVLPAIAQRVRQEGRSRILAWSAGCASGEEPYTLSLVWRFGPAASRLDLPIHILATDIDLEVLRRARRACYSKSSIKEVPESWLGEAFKVDHGQYLIDPRYREGVTFAQHDVREGTPGGPFDLILCRNLVFTYFDADLQRTFARRARRALAPGGFLVIGATEALPPDTSGFTAWPDSRGVYQAVADNQ